eukprot:CAMPEP_0114511370 /NCGR_PEP_ID=MMETSP0109-20121206/14328_1 /TAXON_ID=29199 /ORGANISM="Chlorarachnion reptans, Strain CCCM449" /LENGTH=145 /DNA_ID=CAMNT_0001690827 /DNA_START=1039 /DNA_END=1477 /DNA_ORIENTATION=-
MTALKSQSEAILKAMDLKLKKHANETKDLITKATKDLKIEIFNDIHKLTQKMGKAVADRIQQTEKHLGPNIRTNVMMEIRDELKEMVRQAVNFHIDYCASAACKRNNRRVSWNLQKTYNNGNPAPSFTPPASNNQNKCHPTTKDH